MLSSLTKSLSAVLIGLVVVGGGLTGPLTLTAAYADAGIDVTGTWDAVDNDGDVSVMELEQTGNDVSGSLTEMNGQPMEGITIAGSVTEDTISMTMFIEGMQWTEFTGTISDSATEMHGTWNDPEGEGTWTAAKRDPNGETQYTYIVIDVSAGPNASSYPVSYLDDVPSGGWTDEYKTTKIVLRHIPAGTFIMGSPEDEPE